MTKALTKIPNPGNDVDLRKVAVMATAGIVGGYLGQRTHSALVAIATGIGIGLAGSYLISTPKHP